MLLYIPYFKGLILHDNLEHNKKKKKDEKLRLIYLSKVLASSNCIFSNMFQNFVLIQKYLLVTFGIQHLWTTT